MIKIAVIGYGFVGKASYLPFKKKCELLVVDPLYSNNVIEDITYEKITFICLPAPTLDDGSVDASLIYDAFERLKQINYTGLIVLKSTLPPDITHDLFEQYSMFRSPTRLKYIYSPEFLREAWWEDDAMNPGRIIMAGAWIDTRDLKELYTFYSEIHEDTHFEETDYKTASLLKYATNSFLASKVVWMNQFKELLSDIEPYTNDDDWFTFTSILSLDKRIGESHMNVPGNDGLPGYGGSCFPKDVKALRGIDKLGRLTVLQEVELVNTKMRLQNK